MANHVPTAAFTECGYPRCPNYAVEKGYCPAHYRDSLQARSFRGCNRGNSRFRWMRSAFLNRNPICNLCRREPASVLDHIVRHRGDALLYWDQKNWQGLCGNCHGLKTASETIRPGAAIGSLTVLMGAPGSGKSTWASGRPYVISTDALRTVGYSPERSALVFSDVWQRVDALLSAGENVTLDTTAAHPRIREKAIRIARGRGARLSLVVFDTDLDVCLERQQGRAAPVPPDTVTRIHREIRAQLPGIRFEGWNDIEVIKP
jgi:5-methylcytosine-specific restriction protein A